MPLFNSFLSSLQNVTTSFNYHNMPQQYSSMKGIHINKRKTNKHLPNKENLPPQQTYNNHSSKAAVKETFNSQKIPMKLNNQLDNQLQSFQNLQEQCANEKYIVGNHFQTQHSGQVSYRMTESLILSENEESQSCFCQSEEGKKLLSALNEQLKESLSLKKNYDKRKQKQAHPQGNIIFDLQQSKPEYAEMNSQTKPRKKLAQMITNLSISRKKISNNYSVDHEELAKEVEKLFSHKDQILIDLGISSSAQSSPQETNKHQSKAKQTQKKLANLSKNILHLYQKINNSIFETQSRPLCPSQGSKSSKSSKLVYNDSKVIGYNQSNPVLQTEIANIMQQNSKVSIGFSENIQKENQSYAKLSQKMQNSSSKHNESQISETLLQSSQFSQEKSTNSFQQRTQLKFDQNFYSALLTDLKSFPHRS